MARVFSWLIILALLAGCNLPSPTASPSPTAELPTAEPPAATSTSAPPSAPPPTFEPEPTLSPTGLPGGTPISAANLGQVVPVMDVNAGYTSRLAWALDGQALTAFGADQISRLRLDPLTVDGQFASPSPNTILDVSPDGLSVLTATAGNDLELRSLSGELIGTIPLPARSISAAFSPDGTRLVVASGEEWRVDLIDPASGQVVQSLTGFETAAPVYSASIGADGATLLWLARAAVQPQNIATGQMGPRLEHEDFIGDLELTRSGSLLATTNSKTIDGAVAPIVQLWDPASGADLGRLVLNGLARAISFTPDGSLLAVAVGTEVQIWDPTALVLAGTFSGHAAPVTALAFSPDGSALATAAEDGQIRLWQAVP